MIGEKGPHPIAGGWGDRGVEAGVAFQRALPAGLPGAPVAPPAAGQAAVIVGAANVLGNAYTFTLTDPQNLISASIEAQITICANYVIGLVSRYVAWQGTLDFVVDIQPGSASPYPEADGIMPAVAQIAWNGSSWVNQTLEECLTGVDSDASRPDAGCTIYLAGDGTPRNYGSPAWFDPNPQFEVNPNVPVGTTDFVGIYTHEIFHALGFYEVTQQWRDEITTQSGIAYFEGATAVSLFGGAVPFAAGTDHYGYTDDPAIQISRGLMFQWGNYHRNRLDIGRIDLGILADLGHSIKSYDGLALFELIDTQLNLTGSGAADRLYGDYHANSLGGGGGNDLLDGGAGNDFIDGGSGADTMFGGGGGDKYVVDNIGDVVTETSGGGNDSISTAVDYTLAAGSQVERLTSISWALTTPLKLTGNAFANLIEGNAGNNTLDGRGGADTMVGFGGDDAYVVDHADDVVVENAGQGLDTAYAVVDYRLREGTHVETLSAISWAATDPLGLTGNSFANTLYGNAGNNVLNGGGGADTLVGFGGNDKYVVDNAGDVVVEAAGGGNDSVSTLVDYQLAADSRVERLTSISWALTTPLKLTGNEIANLIEGNAGNNMLDGKGGADTLIAFGGADTFAFTSTLGAGNIDVIEGFVPGTDKVALDDAIFAAIGVALDAAEFRTGAAAADADDRIVYNSATGQLFYDADGVGGAAQVQFATLNGAPLIAASDFLVI